MNKGKIVMDKRYMRAVSIDRITPAADIVLSEVPVPEAVPGRILIKIRAFGLNHSEKLLRLGEINAGYIRKPVIPGIECVGTVEDPSDSGLEKGQTVVALMGGMGRSFNGSYAEYALLPGSIVFPVKTALGWGELGAVPETYFTAWGSLFECLRLERGETLLIRGATCALGYAAAQIASAMGCQIIATTHRGDKLDLLSDADIALVDDGTLTGKTEKADKALDLIGPKYLRDTLTAVKPGGIVCQTGLLGGVYSLNGFDPIKDIPNGVYLTGFFSNYPTQSVMDDIFGFIEEKGIVPAYGKIFGFDDIRSAVTAQDEGGVNGKIVVEIY